MMDRKKAGGRAVLRVLVAAALVAALAACDANAPLNANGGRALPPDGPSQLLNPLCAGTGGTTHHYETIATAVTWPASGNPHHVTGTVTLNTGGQLTLQPGVIVCFQPQMGLQSYGGRLVAQGTPATRIVLTASDPAVGWNGVSLNQEPSSRSLLKHVTIEYTARGSAGVYSYLHPVDIDSTIIRQSGRGVTLWGRGSSFSRSRVDTTTNRDSSVAAVTLHDSTRFEQSVILRAASVGMRIDGAGVQILGGRIEGSGRIGISANQFRGIPWAIAPVRVVGGSSYPIETSAAMLRSLYPTSFWQDSLKGNARDTVLMRGGELRVTLLVRPGLPWHVTGSITVLVGGALRGEAGSRLVLDEYVGISAHSGGRVLLRGSAADPVVVTAEDPFVGWEGITLDGAPTSGSYITNTRVEHVAYGRTAVVAQGAHPLVVDSAVFRRNGQAVALWSAGSRLSRSRVDTTLASAAPAVILGSSAVMESTRVRSSSGEGISVRSSAVQVLSCEVFDSVEEGIILGEAAAVHNCNLVGNGMAGINNKDTTATADATGNWWGAVGGPTAPGGDGVAGAVTYGPWLTAPYVLPYVP